MLYNVRTDEVEVCKVRPEDALELLLDLSVFKYNGTKREPLPAGAPPTAAAAAAGVVAARAAVDRVTLSAYMMELMGLPR